MITVYKFKAVYTKFGIGTAPASAPVCTVVDTSNNILVNAQAVTTLSNMAGVYLYSYSGADGLDLIGLFHTTDTTVDQQDLYSYTPAITANVAVTAANAATLAAGNVAFLSYAHNSMVITSTSTEDLSSATKVWFALKDSYLETDAQSLYLSKRQQA